MLLALSIWSPLFLSSTCFFKGIRPTKETGAKRQFNGKDMSSDFSSAFVPCGLQSEIYLVTT